MHHRFHVAEAHRHHKRWLSGRAYRAGRLVCGCVQVTISLDDRLGLTERERRHVRVSFHEPLDDDLRSELTKLVRRRGAAARRIADTSREIAVIVNDHDNGPLRIVGHLQPPEARHAPATRDRVRPTRADAMTAQPTRRLTGEEIAAVKFAAHRQLTRWADKPRLSPDQHARRNALKRAVHILHDNAFSTGCELRAHGHEEHSDA